MSFILPRCRWFPGLLLLLVFVPGRLQAKSCVWKVTSPSGGVLYLGGSMHHLRSTDYPLPPAFNRAFDLSQRLAFEESPDAGSAIERLGKLAEYPKGDELKNHVDPRSYDYILKVFTRAGTPPEKIARYRPWYLAFLLSSGKERLGPGVESYLLGRAKTYARPVEGLESNNAHLAVFSGLTDKQGEAYLLIRFIQAKDTGFDPAKMTAAWRNGEVNYLESQTRADFRDFPAMADRLLADRNRAWMAKIESWIKSRQTYFVVAGAAHMGGSNGLLSMLRAKGYQIEQW